MTSGQRPPPRLLEALLSRVLPPEDRDAQLGAMAELFEERARRRGRVRATLWYARHAVRFALAVRGATRAGGERGHAGNGEGMMRGWAVETGRAVRRLVRVPMFASVSVLTIAVGVGAFASIFSVVDGVLLEPPAYRSPERLVWVWRDYWFGLSRGWLGGPDVAMLREHDEAFSGVVGFRTVGRNLTDAAGTSPARVRVMLASADFFDVLGVAPVLGRGFMPGEDLPDASAVAVLGWDLWRTQFAGDPAVVGRTLYLNGEAVTVVGVAPETFHFVKHASLGPPEAADLYAPLRMDLASMDVGSGMFAGLARIRDGVDPSVAEAAVAAVAADLDATPVMRRRGLKLHSVGLVDDLVSGVRPTLYALLGAALVLLAALGVNLTTLLLGRATARSRELAVRAALGAGRRRLLESALSEGLVIAALGGALGLVLAWAGVDAIRAFAPPQLPRRAGIALDGTVIGLSVLVTLLMGLGAGLLPAIHAVRGVAADRLREGGRQGSGGLAGSRIRSALVVLQVAMSLTLLVGCGLLTRAFVRLVQADPGFDGREVLTATVPLVQDRYPTDADVAAFDRRMREAVAALPGVTAVGAVSDLPLSAQASQSDATMPGAPGNTGTAEHDAPLTDYMMITPGYLEASGMRLLSGRAFDEGDDGSAQRVALIDDVLARTFYPDGGAVGRLVVILGDTLTVVGVVDQARQYTLAADDRPQIYIPMAQNAVAQLQYVVAGSRDPEVYAHELRRLLDGVDPELPLADVTTLGELVDRAMARERLSVMLLSAFAFGALLLATLGIYGVVSNAVSQRTREIGVRIALGAERRGVLGMILGQGLRLVVAGAALGTLGALAATGVLRSIVVGVDLRDPAVYVAVVLVLALSAGVAAWIPAQRATRIDPKEALRAE